VTTNQNHHRPVREERDARKHGDFSLGTRKRKRFIRIKGKKRGDRTMSELYLLHPHRGQTIKQRKHREERGGERSSDLVKEKGPADEEVLGSCHRGERGGLGGNQTLGDLAINKRVHRER